MLVIEALRIQRRGSFRAERFDKSRLSFVSFGACTELAEVAKQRKNREEGLSKMSNDSSENRIIR